MPIQNEYVVGGAGLETMAAPDKFVYSDSRARYFQKAAMDWLEGGGEDTAPVALLAAPTGAGKTGVIASVADESDRTLCTYPTNRLIEEQQKTLENEFGLDVKTVTAADLSGHGVTRSNELIETAQARDYDVLITNPDILQSAIQGLYFSPNDRIMQLYSVFDAAIFDEFHYYNSLSASGLLMQIKILTERASKLRIESGEEQRVPPDIVLSSATPDNGFVDLVVDELDIDVRVISAHITDLDFTTSADRGVLNEPVEASLAYDIQPSLGTGTPLPQSGAQKYELPDQVVEPDANLHRFRYPMRIRRYDDRIQASFETIADNLIERLPDTATAGEQGVEPAAAVIFNSAVTCNRFQEYLGEEYPALEDVTAKDNGYDTKADTTLQDDYVVLNTTSKGEVGLDFQLKYLVMEAPFTDAAFIQRIGRAARQSTATVDLYGLKDPTWDPTQTYTEFLRNVIQAFASDENPQAVTRELVGMRAAYAITKRLDDSQGIDDELLDELRSMPNQSKWSEFFANMRSIEDTVESAGPLNQPNAHTKTVLKAFRNAEKALASLRGRSVQHPVQYPTADGFDETSYDLLRGLRRYGAEKGDGRAIRLSGTPPARVRALYPGGPRGGDGFDLRTPMFELESHMTDAYTDAVSKANLSRIDSDAPRSLLTHFFELLPLTSTLIPEKISTVDVSVVIDGVDAEVEGVDFSD